MVICIDEALDQLSLTTLAPLCSAELRRYRRKESCENRYCLELLRRAVVEQSEQAWAVVQECFGDTLRCWIRSSSNSHLILLLDTEENYVAQTIARFWFAVHDQPIVFTSLGPFLNYLHVTLNGVLIDTLRTYRRSQVVPLPEADFPGEPATENALAGESLWECMQPLLSDDCERRVAYLLYSCGLKPREIIRRCPGEFADVKEIYRLNQNLVERLRRNRERLRWLLALDN